MVKRARFLMSVGELGVSAKTRDFLRRRFDLVEDVVKYGRVVAYERGNLKSLPKWEAELVAALGKEGYIRPNADFSQTLHVATLYSRVYCDYKEGFVTEIGKLSNTHYETFRGLSEEDIEHIRTALRDGLSERDYELIWHRFGLDGSEMQTAAALGERFGITQARVLQIEERAILKLRNAVDLLPEVFTVPSGLCEAIEKTKAELAELHEDPIFKKERELQIRLSRLSKMPFKRREADAGPTPNNSPDFVLVDELGLLTRTYRSIRCAGIETIADVLNFPKANWKRVRGLGAYGLNDIIEKMHAAGYGDFDVKDDEP